MCVSVWLFNNKVFPAISPIERCVLTSAVMSVCVLFVTLDKWSGGECECECADENEDDGCHYSRTNEKNMNKIHKIPIFTKIYMNVESKRGDSELWVKRRSVKWGCSASK